MLDLTYLSFILYFAVIFIISYYAYLRVNNLSDYVLGGRRINGTVTALSVGSADMSGWLLMALPGAICLLSLNQVWMPIGLVIGAWCNWTYVAKRLRIYTKISKDSQTLPEFFSNRFHDEKNTIRKVMAIVILIFFTVYAAAGFLSFGILLGTISDLTYNQALALGFTAIVVYTIMGGLLAISWVDFLQGSLMFIALFAVATLTFLQWDNVGEILESSHGLSIFEGVGIISIISGLAWSLGYFGQPHILVRFMAISSIKEIPKARFISMSWMILSLLFAIAIGFLGFAYFGLDGIHDPEAIFIQLSRELFPTLLAGLLCAAVASAIMSTAAAQIMASANCLSQDLFKQNKINKLILSRLAVIIVATIAVILALNPDNSILSIVQKAWAGMAASFGPLVILSLYWSRMTKKGAIAGMLVGAISVLLWILARNIFTWEFLDLYEIIPGFLLSTSAIIIFSLYDSKPEQKILTDFNLMLSHSK